MDPMQFKKEWVISQLKKNRSTHREKFLLAQGAYKAAVLRQLEQSLEDARNNKRPNLSFMFIEPKDQTEDYDCSIGMLENSVGDMVELSKGEYLYYILDKWQWKAQFTATNSAYGISE